MSTHIVDEVLTIPHLPIVKIQDRHRLAMLAERWRWLDDIWFWITLVTAMTISITAFIYFYGHHDILLYNDAHSHLDIARRVLDNATPGLAQLGGVWLPLPHIVMLPFIWIDPLWRSGLAGAFPSMICDIICALYLFMAARRLTNDNLASYIGTIAFMVNPNILYLQSTPLSELVLLATMAATCYYLIVWAQEDRLSDLVAMSIATFLAALARYDGWALYLACIVLLMLIGWRKGFRWGKIQGAVLFYGLVGGFAIGLWLLWCKLIFGDALYFQHSQYSAQTQQQMYIQSNRDPMYHNLFLSVRDTLWLAGETIGPVLLGLGIFALIVYLLRSRLSPQGIAALAFLVPTAFYIVAYYGGQAIMYAPGAAPGNIPVPWFNTRYGITIVLPLTIFLSTLATRWPLGKIIITIVIIAQSYLVATGGIVTLQDGQVGISCYLYTELPIYLAQHYNGGNILNDTYHTAQDYAAAGIDLRQVVYQGSGRLWQASLQHPEQHVDWVVMIPGDIVGQAIANDPTFTSDFTLLLQDPASGVFLYHRNGLPPLPTRTIPPDLSNNYYARCNSGV